MVKHTNTRTHCPGKGGAKRSAGAYTSDFYAGPVIPPGARRGPPYCVNKEADIPAEPASSDRAALFTPPQKCAVARCPEQRPRLPRLWVCAAHQHRQCASCAAVGRGVRHCCARGHAGHPRPSMAPRGQQRGARRAEAHPPRAGGTPSAKRRRRQRALAPGPDRERPHKRGRADATPPPPCQEDAMSTAGRRQAWQSRDSGDITPNPRGSGSGEAPHRDPSRHQRQRRSSPGLYVLSF